MCPHHECVDPGSRYHELFICQICKYHGELRKAFFITVAPEHILLHAKMYAIGHEYSVFELKSLALDKFKASCEKFWNHDMFLEAADYAIAHAPLCCPTLKVMLASTVKLHPELLCKPAIRARIQQLGLTDWALEEIKQRRRRFASALATTGRLGGSTTPPGSPPLPPASE